MISGMLTEIAMKGNPDGKVSCCWSIVLPMYPVWGEVERSLQLLTCSVGLIQYTLGFRYLGLGQTVRKKEEKSRKREENQKDRDCLYSIAAARCRSPQVSSEWKDRPRGCSLSWRTSGELGSDQTEGMNPHGHCSWYLPKRRTDHELAIQILPLPWTWYRKVASFKYCWFLRLGRNWRFWNRTLPYPSSLSALGKHMQAAQLFPLVQGS